MNASPRSLQRARRGAVPVLFLGLALGAMAAAQPPTAPGGGFTGTCDPQKAPLAELYAGNDGGAYFVRERNGNVYWFAEHPGRGYAHVFHGRRTGKRVVGRFASVPLGDATGAGELTLELDVACHLKIVAAPAGFPTKSFTVKSLQAILAVLPASGWPRFGSTERGDLDGGFVDEAGRRWYLRQIGDRVAGLMESPVARGERPTAAYVFFGERSGQRVAGDLIAVPKGERDRSGRLTLTVGQQRTLEGRADFALPGLFLRPLLLERELPLLGYRSPVPAVTQFENGAEVFEGDIVVSRNDDFRSLVIADRGRYWKDCEVPFNLDPAGTNGMTAADRAQINAAIQTYNTQTNFRWRPRAAGDRDFVDFRAVTRLCVDEDKKEITCGRSSLGRVGGRQLIQFSQGRGFGSFVHEMGHAVGLVHEQTRFDRDQFVQVVAANILPGKEGNFEKRPKSTLDTGPYDFGSIMHYGRNSFSRNGRATLVPKVEGVTLGSSSLSQGDLNGLGHLCPVNQKADGVGRRGHGAGIAVAALDADPRPDLIALAYDDAEGENVFKYRVGLNADATGLTNWRATILTAPGVGARADGADLAVGDLDGNGRPEMIVLAYDSGDPDNTLKYRIARDLDATGRPAGAWSGTLRVTDGATQPRPLSLGTAGEGAGLALGDIDRDGALDLVVAVYDAPEGANRFKYVIGRGIQADGSATWTGPFTADGLGDRADGAGVAVADVDGNGRPEILLMALDDTAGEDVFKVRFLMNVTTDGVSNETRIERYLAQSNSSDGAGLAVADMDGDGENDLIVLSYDDPGNDGERDNDFKYRVLRSAAVQ